MSLQVGDKVKTPNGEGYIKKIERYSRINERKRYCILVPGKGLSCYWESEIKQFQK